MPYATWVEQGLLRATEGDATDFKFIGDEIIQLRQELLNDVDLKEFFHREGLKQPVGKLISKIVASFI